MKINPPSAVRTILYITSVFVNAMVGVLLVNEITVSAYALALIAGLNAVVALMAGVNVNPEEY